MSSDKERQPGIVNRLGNISRIAFIGGIVALGAACASDAEVPPQESVSVTPNEITAEQYVRSFEDAYKSVGLELPQTIRDNLEKCIKGRDYPGAFRGDDEDYPTSLLTLCESEARDIRKLGTREANDASEKGVLYIIKNVIPDLVSKGVVPPENVQGLEQRVKENISR